MRSALRIRSVQISAARGRRSSRRRLAARRTLRTAAAGCSVRLCQKAGVMRFAAAPTWRKALTAKGDTKIAARSESIQSNPCEICYVFLQIGGLPRQQGFSRFPLKSAPPESKPRLRRLFRGVPGLTEPLDPPAASRPAGAELWGGGGRSCRYAGSLSAWKVRCFIALRSRLSTRADRDSTQTNSRPQRWNSDARSQRSLWD